MELKFKVGDYAIYKDKDNYSLVEVKEAYSHDVRDRLKQDGLFGEPTGTTFHKENTYIVNLHKGDNLSILMLDEYSLIKISNWPDVQQDLGEAFLVQRH